MKFLCILLGFVVWCGCCFSEIYGTTDLRNYVYDEQGNAVFIKIYVRSALSNEPKQDMSCASLNGDAQAILTRMIQEDLRGSYIVVPIKKKKIEGR